MLSNLNLSLILTHTSPSTTPCHLKGSARSLSLVGSKREPLTHLEKQHLVSIPARLCPPKISILALLSYVQLSGDPVQVPEDPSAL